MFQPYSHSKIQTFESCPQMFKFRYIDKVKPEQRPDCFERGASIHAELERYPEMQSDSLRDFLASKVGRKYDIILRGETQREVRIGLNQDFKLSKYNYTNLINGIIDVI